MTKAASPLPEPQRAASRNARAAQPHTRAGHDAAHAAPGPAEPPRSDAAPAAQPVRAQPGPADDRQGSAALTLLQLQADMRKAKTQSEIAYFIANEARSVLRAQQVVVFSRGRRNALALHTVSSLTSVDRSSPLVLWMESIVARLAQDTRLAGMQEFEAHAFAAGFETVQQAYPLHFMLWVPWVGADGKVANGMLLARTTPWAESELTIIGYMAGAFAHAWRALDATGGRTWARRLLTRRNVLATSAAALLLLLVPVPMTALAPVEVSPRESFVVTPGVEGIVRSVEVEPNAAVKTGQTLVVLNDTILKNRAEIAEREVLVADTKYKKAAQLAFVDARGRHEMAIAKSELELKLAERDYARDLLGRTEIRAERDGIAFFADKKDLVGKPVTVGEKLMEVADPEAAEFRIELPVSDAIVLRNEARVKVFLDSDPLHPIEATLKRAAYKAAAREQQQLSFRVVAERVSPGEASLRLGSRGTAQIYSDDVPVGFYLFRRPIAAARQWIGL